MSIETTPVPAKSPPKRRVTGLAALTALGGLLFGYDTGVVSGALLFIESDFALSSFQLSVVVSVMMVGAVLGASACGPLSDRFGRRGALAFSASAFILGAVMAAAAPGYGWLVAARIVQGVGVGSAALTVPVYIAEVVPARARGALVSLNQLMITIGILAAYLVNYAFASAEAWRWMFGVAAAPAVVLLIALLFLPESPRWLVARGRSRDAVEVLKRFGRESDAERLVAEIRNVADQESGSMRALFGPMVRPALGIGLVLALFQTITGIDTVIYYAPTILHSAGADAATAILSTVGVGIVNVAMTVVAILLLDRVGRRPPLLGGTVVMALGLTILGASFWAPAEELLPQSLSLLALMVFVGAFAIGLGPVFWLINSEIYPLRLRARAAGLATMMIFGSNAVVSATFLPMVDALGKAGAFWVYAGITVLAAVFIYHRVPETKGRTLEEIERAMGMPTVGTQGKVEEYDARV